MNIHESDYKQNNFHIDRGEDTLSVNLTYPNLKQGVTHVYVNQESVRASDGIRMHYDYARDGWAIEQASVFEWSADDKVQDEGWKEVAFVRSWACEVET